MRNITQFPDGEDNQDPTVQGNTAGTEDPPTYKAAPAAKRLAAELGVDLATISNGSGQGGKILKTDVEKEFKRLNKKADSTPDTGGNAKVADEPKDKVPELAETPISFNTKLIVNILGERFYLSGVNTDAFGTIELMFEKAHG